MKIKLMTPSRILSIYYSEQTIRFLRQFSPGIGNYTEERAARADEETLDEVLAAIKARREKEK